MKSLFLVIFFFCASVKAELTEIYRCSPQDMLMGQWDVSIYDAGHSAIARTTYLKQVFPGNKPIVREFTIGIRPTGKNIYNFYGDNFDLYFYFDQKPKRNPFYEDNEAFSAQLSAKFADGVELKGRPYACIAVKASHSTK